MRTSSSLEVTARPTQDVRHSYKNPEAGWRTVHPHRISTASLVATRMGASTFSFFSNIFGFVVAAISLLAFLVNICRSHLPSNKIRELESLMDQTETFFRKAIEDGLLTEPTFVQQTERHLAM